MLYTVKSSLLYILYCALTEHTDVLKRDNALPQSASCMYIVYMYIPICRDGVEYRRVHVSVYNRGDK